MSDRQKGYPYAKDFLKTVEREVISPEGVEERVVAEYRVEVRLTGGGKYRVYSWDGKEMTPPVGVKVCDDLDTACASVMVGLSMLALLANDPIETMLHVLGDKNAKRS